MTGRTETNGATSKTSQEFDFESLPWLDVHSREFIRDPHAQLRPLRGRDFARSERGLEVLSYAASEAILRQENLEVGFEEMLTACGITDGRAYVSLVNSVSNNEGSAHYRQRRAIAPYFQPKHIETMRASLRSALEKRFKQIRRHGECDLVELVGRWLPATSFCMMAGVPLDERPFIWSTSEKVMRFFEMNPSNRDVIVDGFEELDAFAEALIESRYANPGDDLVSFLVAAEQRGELSLTEVRDLLVLLILGSTDTTSSQAACMFNALAAHPELWTELRNNALLVPNAVLETARHQPGVWTVTRVARNQTVCHDLEVPDHTTIFVDFIAANRDPAVYNEPDVLDVRRDLERAPLNWSVGRHFCPGRPLAVMELQETLSVALAEWNTFRVNELEAHGAPYVVSVDRLVVEFESSAEN